MRRSTLRSFGAAMLFVPLVATCTQPSGMIASAHEHMRPGSEDRLISFLIDGDMPAASRASG